MKRKEPSAFAKRAFTQLAEDAYHDDRTIRMEITIHAGGGNCVCNACERAMEALERIWKAGKP